MSTPSVLAIVDAATAEWAHWGKATWNCITGAKSSGFHVDDETAYARYVIDTYLPLHFRPPIRWPSPADISNDDYYWSAVCVSYIMRKAGFAPADFPIGQAHSTYVTWAIKNRKSGTPAAYWGYRVDDALATPEVGDIIAYARGRNMTRAKALTYYDRTGGYESHADIVVAKRPGEIDVIGGNVRDSVTKKTLRIDASGRIADPHHHWFAVMRRRDLAAGATALISPTDWRQAAVKITCGFEVNGDPYEGVSGDFDGMGVSCGALQWNIGSNSLQPMVKAVGKPAVLAAMPTLGAAFWTACNGSVSAGLTTVRGWQSGSKLNATAKAELKALMGSAGMRAEQDKRIDEVADRAQAAMDRWVADGGTSSKRLFCWFFDLVTQNGGMKTLTRAKVLAFIAAAGPANADDVVCDFLAGQAGTGHAKDARANGALWRGVTGEKLELLVMSYLRSDLSASAWRLPVMNRKGAIAIGKGHVNGGLWDFSALGL
ncbi:DUF2272 domain-containing protein [Brevundimonas lenta]|uniref:DUF2272 domain-containing protein n=1 Tax=Brevundimonas lenta TaxID=424796 RepID=A0A7W6NQV7_9CAUL|nr:DUF2272 domain-containing protein [Brevundimonas lenta]MBB4084049.1 hypothetical protein [Brevundimonas lenta]